MSEYCYSELDFGEHWFMCQLPADGHAKHAHKGDTHGVNYTVTWDAQPQTVDANPSRMEIT